MTKIKKIYISSDPLMTKETEQFSNRRWLKDLLFRPICRATGFAPETLASSRTNSDHINRKVFFELSGIDVDLDETQFWYDEKQINEESLNYLSGFIGPETLVVGYELSKQTCNILTRLEVPYIDIWLHPIRFLDDVLFGFNSNQSKVRSRLFDFNLSEDQMYLYADRIRIQTYKGWRRQEAQVKPGAALCVGQMMNDKSVCLDGKMLCILDFKDRFEQIAAQHSVVYYARHPYLRSGDEEIISYLESLDNVELTDIPSYRLLASQRIQKVFGLSSSMIHEAKYFNKQAEFLFRPIIEYGDKSNPDSFSTVLQEFISPHFWAHVLQPLVKTKDCARVMFLDPKDKVRDMLGFYWGYPEVDKVENMRRVQQAQQRRKAASAPAVKKVVPAKKTTFPCATGFIQSEKDYRRLKSRIDAHDTISFDIFDTLVERIVNEPSDIHHLMENKVHTMTNGVLSDFPKLRRESRGLANCYAHNEEILLKDRYKALAEHCGLSQDMGEQLYQFELELERAVCRTRFFGHLAFEYAKKTKKRIILVSDTYFDRPFVEHLLTLCDYQGWDALYLSSEEGYLKQSGNLFDRVLEYEKIEPETIMHIGDNAIADIEMARLRGISTFHVPHKLDLVRKLSPMLEAYNEIKDLPARSLIQGLVSRRITSGLIPNGSGFTHGDPSILGYVLLGPLFFGFARWLLGKSLEEGITDLYFLARDGEIAMRCFDILSLGEVDAPRSHYILASRRSGRVATIRRSQDILEMLELNFTPCPLGELLLNRFGVKPATIPSAAYGRHGFSAASSLADWRTGKEDICGFFSDPSVTELILENAEVERAALKTYYQEQGLVSGNERKIGFVDIGHAGSLQIAICELMDLEKTVGLYFATSENIDHKMPQHGHSSFGYLVDRMKASETLHPYRRHILMFELIFQNTHQSFVKINMQGNPEYLKCGDDSCRTEFIRKTHDAVSSFVEDFVESVGASVFSFRLRGLEASAAYRTMLEQPFPLDVELFRGIAFENVYSARARRWIIPPKGRRTDGLWKEGMLLLNGLPGSGAQQTNMQKTVVRVASAFVKDERKKSKLHREPHRFFLDSKHPIAKLFGKTIMR